MKKIMFIAMAAAVMLVVSCNNSARPVASEVSEAAKAWSKFKAASEKISTPAAAEQFENFGDFNDAVQEWNAAAKEMTKYASEYSKEIADSMNAIANAVSENVRSIVARQEAANGLAGTDEE
jgi:hypothetical protein